MLFIVSKKLTGRLDVYSLTGIPCARRCSLTWRIEKVRKWKTEAASTRVDPSPCRNLATARPEVVSRRSRNRLDRVGSGHLIVASHCALSQVR